MRTGPRGGETRRLLLLQYQGEARRQRAGGLRALGFDVVTADPFDLHWPKMIAGGKWAAIVIDLSCIGDIAVEVAAELEENAEPLRIPILLVGSPDREAGELPTPIRDGKHFANDEELADYLKHFS
ncbi:MAG TPA: hypothetical protein VMX35_09325 [Acidobacteriota bacterium]|nr:hypothetical protein [Acidobacteriota bacterium]